MNPLIVGIGHKMQSGKDTFAMFLAEALQKAGHTVAFDSFAGPLKASARELFDLPAEYDKTKLSPVRWRMFDGKRDGFMTYRELLQQYGRMMRKAIPGFWWQLLYDRCERDLSDFVIVTDMRFVDEATVIRTYRGMTIRINRDIPREGPEHRDASETELLGWRFDMTIQNNGTLDDLSAQAKYVAEHLQHVAKSRA